MAPQYDMIKATANVAYQYTEADTRELVRLLTGRDVARAEGVPGSVSFVLDGVAYGATYRIGGEWWDRKNGNAWGTRMAGIEGVHVARIGNVPDGG